MQVCTIQFVNRLLTCASIRAHLCFIVLVFLLVFLLLASQQNALADAGVINRTPFSEVTKKETSLDKLADSLGDIVKSIDQIVAEPEEESVILIAGPEETEALKKNPETIIPAPVAAEPTTPEPIVAEPTVVEPVVIKPEPVEIVETAPMAKPMQTATKAETKLATPIQQPITDKAGMAYLKYNRKGETLEDTAATWACVEDTRNGLIWEVKNNDGGLRDKKHSYSWFDPANENLQGIADGGRCKGGIQCDTHAYVQALNAQNYCGHSDWRLPTREEIQQLVDLSNDKAEAKINTKLFPGTEPSWYWTSSSNENNPDYAWYVLFRNGIPLNDLKARPKHIRLVRTDKEA